MCLLGSWAYFQDLATIPTIWELHSAAGWGVLRPRAATLLPANSGLPPQLQTTGWNPCVQDPAAVTGAVDLLRRHTGGLGTRGPAGASLSHISHFAYIIKGHVHVGGLIFVVSKIQKKDFSALHIIKVGFTNISCTFRLKV